MPYQQLRLTISGDVWEKATEALETLGALAITTLDAENQPIYEPLPGTTPIWDKITLVALFAEENHLSVENIEDKAWERECMDQFKPMPFGKHLWICPSWHEVTLPDAVVVKLDPGLAFGTGTHPTTRLCLDWLANEILSGQTMMDYGCGSGILGVAALKLGAAKVIGVDIDPQALEAANANAENNGVKLETYFPEMLPPQKVNIILANILANPLMTLAPTFLSHLEKNGKLVLSGILEEQIPLIRNTYDKMLYFVHQHIEDGWARLVYYTLQHKELL
jgi:ribosomal protein L11 methyltransferase